MDQFYLKMLWITNKGLDFVWHFNNYDQPIRKGGYMFMRFLGYIARIERFCSIGTISLRKLNKMYKADIIEVVWVSNFFF